MTKLTNGSGGGMLDVGSPEWPAWDFDLDLDRWSFDDLDLSWDFDLDLSWSWSSGDVCLWCGQRLNIGAEHGGAGGNTKRVTRHTKKHEKARGKGAEVATYRFRLVDVTVIVKSQAGARGPRFEAQVMDADGRLLGRGWEYSEPAAVGLAVLAAGKEEGIDVD